jgi:putative oxidoreductase
MLRTLFATDPSSAALILRIGLAAVIFPHGAQKVLGWFGGHGLQASLGFFKNALGIPAPLALLAIAAEFLAPMALVAGLGGRVAALGIGVTMLVALTVHRANGFFMNWSGAQKGEGFEYHLAVIAIAVAVSILGSGAWSIDRVIARSV